MTGARGLQPTCPRGPGGHDLQQDLTVGLIQAISSSGWLWYWERAILVDIDTNHIRFMMTVERGARSHVALVGHGFVCHRHAPSAASDGSIPLGVRRDK